MLEILTVVVFVWLFWNVLKLLFKITWGTAKVIAVLLAIAALPALTVCLLFAGGILLLVPVAVIAIAWWLLKVCI